MDLENKTAIVTGMATGIGKGIALRLAADGAAVAGLDIQIEKAQQTASEIVTAGGQAVALKADVTDYAAVKAATDAVVKQFGHVDILVNNAGAYPQTEFKDLEPEAWKWILDLNINGTFNCTHAVINHMVERTYGRIINIASIAAEVGIRRMATYSASKGAIVSFTKALAMEVGPHNITVNSVSPGAILVNNAQSNYENKGIYLPRPGGYPADVAAAVSYLVSEDAAYVTGADLLVDGGRILGPRGS
ncbi:MAG: SDR family oxidoreductase [Lentisphaerae bacterium]|jgi:NAD(P)-dependent dehydrogenase (short-subunit alcohol dehydrogenase family)|nr:SDR family oxidoreductase [Lentisphaerota bacterium]MBT4816043.1 SDR family oxidoreductase [Lentisphaerota bacterium]MBT5611728.1 SDR family oxidoreductase [Lentisphaerota bacterium]MBT7060432.1 SDR family oxidoreductase [Lentisphaerota bacterium]MBT7848435.1 SDR family oxidoreductase [Lentisphaerota bacterium]